MVKVYLVLVDQTRRTIVLKVMFISKYEESRFLGTTQYVKHSQSTTLMTCFAGYFKSEMLHISVRESDV